MFIDFFHYHNETRKNFYPCKLTSEYYSDKDGNIIVQYKTFGKRNRYYIAIKDIFLDKKLLEKFSPPEVSKITLIAFGEIFFSTSSDKRENKFGRPGRIQY